MTNIEKLASNALAEIVSYMVETIGRARTDQLLLCQVSGDTLSQVIPNKASLDTITPIITYGPMVLNPHEIKCTWHGITVKLTARQFRIVLQFARHPNMVVTRNIILDIIHPNGEAQFYERTIDSHIKRIRMAFRAIDPNFDFIETIYAGGYRLREDTARAA